MVLEPGFTVTTLPPGVGAKGIERSPGGIWGAMFRPGDVKFDPTGVYGTDLYAATAFASPINTIDSVGTPTLFSSLSSVYLRFGPGGAWGTGLYATDVPSSGLAKVDSLGTATPFAGPFGTPEGFDWAFGPGFDGDMFLSDLTSDQIYRIESDGSSSVFALLIAAADVSYCNDALYVVSFAGGCYKITSNIAPVPALSMRGLLGVVLSLVLAAGFIAARRMPTRPVREAGR